MLRLFLVIFTLFTVSNVVFAYPEDTPSRDLGMRDERMILVEVKIIGILTKEKER